MSANGVQTKGQWLKHIDFFIVDLIATLGAYFLACIVRLGQIHGGRFTSNIGALQIDMAWVLLLLLLVVQSIAPLHAGILKRTFFGEITATFTYVSSLAVLLLLFQYFTKKSDEFSRGIYLYFWIFSAVLVLAARTLYKAILNKRLRNSGRLPKLLIVSSDVRLEENIKYFKQHSINRYWIVGIAVVTRADKNLVLPKESGDIKILEGEEEMYTFIKDNVIEEVLLSISNTETEKAIMQEMLLMGIKTHINLDRVFNGMPNLYVEKMADQLVLTSSIQPFSPVQQLGKRLLDILGAIVGLIITAIAFIFVAPIIKIKSPGPVFFSQMRVGKNGKRFKIYKFRSMYMDAEKRKAELMEKNEMQGLMFKMENDPRIIGSGPDGTKHGIGHFIRKYSIDELPQFLNVLLGDMSLVGTRPPTVDEWEQYERHHRARLAIKPGITGLWQVSGRSDITDFDEVVALDLRYIQDWSLKEDIKIILQTIAVVLGAKGSK